MSEIKITRAKLDTITRDIDLLSESLTQMDAQILKRKNQHESLDQKLNSSKDLSTELSESEKMLGFFLTGIFKQGKEIHAKAYSDRIQLVLDAEQQQKEAEKKEPAKPSTETPEKPK